MRRCGSRSRIIPKGAPPPVPWSHDRNNKRPLPRDDGSHVSPVRTRPQFDPATRLVNDNLEEYGEETKNLDFLAGVNHVIETHKNDPTPRPYKISPDHPDLVQHDDAPGFWHPKVTAEERQKLMAEMRDLQRHSKEHGVTLLFDEDCPWCLQRKEKNGCLKPGCLSTFFHDGDHDMAPGWR